METKLITLPTILSGVPTERIKPMPEPVALSTTSQLKGSKDFAAMRKVPRSNARSWMLRQLQVQGGLCRLCGKPIDVSIKGEGVTDHSHDTGEIRGILHRSCNSAEGKITNAAGHWGAKSMSYPAIIDFLKRTVAYLEAEGCGVMYHAHKTPDEQRDARNLKARQRRAENKAKLALRGSK
jgi:hypothetical protein